MVDTEKVTVNLNIVDLGKIDMLVDEGFYNNRADFLRTAIRNEIALHRHQIDQISIAKSYVMGVIRFGAEDLRGKLEAGKMTEIRCVGVLVLDDDITPQLAEQTIRSIKVWGKSIMPDDVRERLQNLERIG